MSYSHPNYTIVRSLGSGASSNVYLAVQKRLNRRVAIKVIEAGLQDRQYAQRFKREALILAQLQHPNIVPVYELHAPPEHEHLALVMRHMASGTLRDRIAGLTLGECLRICRAMLAGLHFTHERGYLHRDIKPDNVFFDGEDIVLGDFGVARSLHSETELTQLGSVIGTPDYMSPEQLRGESIDRRSDLYSFGVVLYEMLTGHKPFVGDSAISIGIAQNNLEPTRLPPPLRLFQPILDQLLAKNPTARFADAAACQTQMEQLQDKLLLALDTELAKCQLPSEASATFSEPAPERRQISVMYCALARSDSPSDPEDMHQRLLALENKVIQASNRYDGTIAQRQASGFLVYFGYPRAQEDDPIRAVHAALSIANAPDARDKRDTRDESDARVSVHTGMVVVFLQHGTKQPSAIGEVPGIPVHMEHMSNVRGVIISEQTRTLLGDTFSIGGRFQTALPGAGTIDCFQVLGERDTETRYALRSHLGTLFGREQELNRLSTLLHTTRSGQGSAVAIVGEAGIGKSALAFGFCEEAGLALDEVITLQCSAYHADSALHPFSRMVRHAARNENELNAVQFMMRTLRLTQATAVECLRSLGLEALIGDDDDQAHPPNDLSATERRNRLLISLVNAIEDAAREKPRIIIVEDAHWADPTTLELINQVSLKLARLRLMIIVTSRPEGLPHLCLEPRFTRIDLAGLADHALNQVIDSSDQDRRLTSTQRDIIIKKADGVPIFAEELVRALLHSSDREAASATTLEIPGTLRDALMSRLDSQQHLKAVVQAAACIGREFDLNVVAAVLDLEQTAAGKAIRDLEDAGIVEASHIGGRRHLSFRHALLSDAAYQSLLAQQRRGLHERILKILLTQTAPAPEVIAHHAQEAGDYKRAFKGWEAAGERARDIGAYEEAIRYFQKAVEAVRQDATDDQSNDQVLNTLVKRAHCCIALHGFAHPESVRANAEARQMLNTVGATEHRLPLLYGHWVIAFARGDQRAAMIDAQELMREAESSQDRVQLMLAQRYLGASHCMRGNFVEAETYLQGFQALYDRSKDQNLAQDYGIDPFAPVQSYLAISRFCCGAADEGKSYLFDLENYAQKTDHMHTKAFALAHLAMIGQFARLPDRWRYSYAAEEFADEHGMGAYMGHTKAIHAMLEFESDNTSTGLALMHEALAIIDASDTYIYAPLLFASYASALASEGQLVAADAAEGRALALIEAGDEHWSEPEIHRILGWSHYRDRGNFVEAERRIYHSIELAQQLGTNMWIARATNCLAELRFKMGDTNGAKEVLANQLRSYDTDVAPEDLATSKALLDRWA